MIFCIHYCSVHVIVLYLKEVYGPLWHWIKDYVCSLLLVSELVLPNKVSSGESTSRTFSSREEKNTRNSMRLLFQANSYLLF